MTKMNVLINTAAGLLTAVALCGAAHGQEAYPVKPVKLVSGTAGGVQDVLARVLAPELQKNLGQVVVVEPRPGAAGAISAEAVARAPADGYTFLLAVGAITVLPALNKKLSFDVVKDFSAITLLASAPNVFAVRADSPIKDLKDLIAEAKKKPGEITYATSGIGSTVHIGTEFLQSLTGIKLFHIPYNGSRPSVEALLGGQVMSSMSSASVSQPLIKAGRLRAIGVTTQARSVFLPEVPTFEELGVKGMRSDTWLGLMGPANLPRNIAIRLNAELQQIMGKPDMKEKILNMGSEPVGLPLEKFAAQIKYEVELFDKLVQSAGIKAE
ncbi:MAG: Bug family tripartite tricarboxylate transporter substrate binding protein [Burkholderiales bacterium]